MLRPVRHSSLPVFMRPPLLAPRARPIPEFAPLSPLPGGPPGRKRGLEKVVPEPAGYGRGVPRPHDELPPSDGRSHQGTRQGLQLVAHAAWAGRAKIEKIDRGGRDSATLSWPQLWIGTLPRVSKTRMNLDRSLDVDE